MLIIAIISILVFLLFNSTSDKDREFEIVRNTTNEYREITIKDSIFGTITITTPMNGTYYIKVNDSIRCKTAHRDYLNNGVIKQQKVELLDVLRKGAVIRKKGNNDTLLIIYRNKKYYFYFENYNPNDPRRYPKDKLL